MYSVDDARREIYELMEEGYGFDVVRIFLNDLVRSGDITSDDRNWLIQELLLCGPCFGCY